MSILMNNLTSLTRPQNFKAARVSSWDKTGANRDNIELAAGERRVIADIEGPGVISHIWFTILSGGPYLRQTILRIYWDDETEPSVCSPIGDFFGLGHAQMFTYQCAFFSTSTNPEGPDRLGVAMNCWLPMPFKKRARIEVEAQECTLLALYYYIDYQKHESLPDDVLYLHAMWRRENPCKVHEGDGIALIRNEDWLKSVNLTDKYNYEILSAEGRGHYIGANFSIDNLVGRWWGEGDDMIFIDRDGERHWPPDLHGTGSEDYLCHAWGMQRVAHMYAGLPWAESEDHNNEGKVCVYRYHVLDPIPFEKNIRVSIEHGHANDRGDDWSSVAYWYQDEPHKTFVELLPVEQRIPR